MADVGIIICEIRREINQNQPTRAIEVKLVAINAVITYGKQLW